MVDLSFFFSRFHAMNFDLLSSPSFHAFMFAFCVGVLWGYVLHALLRAPRWIVGMLTTND